MANVHTAIAAPSGNIFGAFFTKLFNGLVSIAEANSRVRTVERLNAMSDAELAQMGIQRADIVRHVFRDSFYI
ncbi:DUF1127 domain-containing protein [Mameliella sediminis]|uniref:DUF1127 domain-containing protein n=1 Tax=Mameliella sediminis TaxID=2836866 RepID=UPI001C490AB4|nr:DUF1127 domain-containing protein [Mameliella sediminis]MBY6113394.1 DUF1127 domain-containing protein [Antarctobacter heliothermus]MBY6143258.1 DUF1127 domain-containing protein [Mameliella alba]MBV7394692.1 DUF1127 domain-containing protein [Mameliella sediminis]MBY6163141.1 DUF1127 domain-containing protein [Mameliella alba]MBY6171405.1 DUF1127 domain-containing protein [Mameliella alba]